MLAAIGVAKHVKINLRSAPEKDYNEGGHPSLMMVLRSGGLGIYPMVERCRRCGCVGHPKTQDFLHGSTHEGQVQHRRRTHS